MSCHFSGSSAFWCCTILAQMACFKETSGGDWVHTAQLHWSTTCPRQLGVCPLPVPAILSESCGRSLASLLLPLTLFIFHPVSFLGVGMRRHFQCWLSSVKECRHSPATLRPSETLEGRDVGSLGMPYGVKDCHASHWTVLSPPDLPQKPGDPSSSLCGHLLCIKVFIPSPSLAAILSQGPCWKLSGCYSPGPAKVAVSSTAKLTHFTSCSRSTVEVK